MLIGQFHTLLYRVALIGLSATFFVSCGRKPLVEPPDMETLITMQSTDLTVLNSVNGNLSYRFETPLLERYELAGEPYMEFRKGIKVASFNDSTHVQESDLVADYAKYLESQQLWEARGNVVATNAKGQRLETEQLFWDEKADRIYSNVESTMYDGEDISVGDGFETDSKFEDYRIRNPRGHVTVDTEPKRDSTAVNVPADSLSVLETPVVPPATAGASAPGPTAGQPVLQEPEELLPEIPEPVLREGETPGQGN